MKKLLLSLALLVGFASTLWAEDVTIDGIKYSLDAETKQASVIAGDSKYSGSVVIPASVTYNGANYSVTSIEKDAFYNCKGLTSVTIPNSVTSIGNSAFRSCSGLTSVTIPKSVTSIGEWAFYKSSLNSITIPNSVTNIGNYAFSDCVMTSIVVESGNNVYDSRNNCNAIIETSTNKLIVGCVNTIIPNSVTSIGDSAFEGCYGLTSVTIPNSVTSIEKDAFSRCYELTSVTIGNSVTSIGEWAFYNCYGLTSVTIPGSVKSIGNYAFDYCSGLTSVTIGNSVTSIGKEAFQECSGLTSVTIPKSVTSIGDKAFYECSNVKELIYAEGCTTALRTYLTSITSVTIPNSVTSIEMSAFSSCSGLTSITIPNSVTSIGSYAFYNCSGLTSLTCEATTPPTLSSQVFYNVPTSTGTLYVPASEVSDYQTADQWKDWGTIKAIEATDIKAVTSDATDTSAPLYNLQGQRVTAPVKGQVYIQNGKKVVM